ncbi:MAG TPA: ABC transporter ATP-binding protein [Acidimicrobiales bacterium]|jgi:branched-chain amino acid transport system ATP-binding protein|nr:ABC transporter ATP-binding protein [Acidimicrobiales bacterium]
MNEPATPLLEVRSIRAGYGPIEVLHDVDFQVFPGKVAALLGPNGGGKSTLLNVCAGVHQPDEGEVWFEGENVTRTSAGALSRRGICTVPEGRGVFPNLTVRENVLMATQVGAEMAHLEEVTYSRFPRLGERRKQLAGTLSGGEQQMLALARAFGTDPKLVMLDELSMGLAPIVVRQLYELVTELASQGLSILVVEQFARTVLPIANSVAVMLQGQIVRQGTPAELEDDLSSSYLGT